MSDLYTEIRELERTQLIAEIERLKADKQHAGVECIAYIGELAESQVENKKLKALITELVDVLRRIDYKFIPLSIEAQSDLQKRAREANKPQ